MQPFDLLGPLPAPRSTTVLEASAGTGKTFALAGLVTRYLAEGRATLDQMLLVTFSRSATQELRERVRAQIVQAVRAFDDRSVVGDNQVVQHLLTGTDEELKERKTRLRDALAAFDAATIATTHQFCNLVLKSLGVAGDSDAGVELVESLDDLVAEIVDELEVLWGDFDVAMSGVTAATLCRRCNPRAASRRTIGSSSLRSAMRYVASSAVPRFASARAAGSASFARNVSMRSTSASSTVTPCSRASRTICSMPHSRT